METLNPNHKVQKIFRLILTAVATALLAETAIAESLECELLKEKIISQHRALNSDQRTPEQIRAERRERARQEALYEAQLDPYERANYLTQKGASQLVQGLAGNRDKDSEETKRLENEFQNNMALYKQNCE